MVPQRRQAMRTFRFNKYSQLIEGIPLMVRGVVVLMEGNYTHIGGKVVTEISILVKLT